MSGGGCDGAPLAVLLMENGPGDVHLSQPVKLDALETLGKSIGDFWLTVVKLPHQQRSVR